MPPGVAVAAGQSCGAELMLDGATPWGGLVLRGDADSPPLSVDQGPEARENRCEVTHWPSGSADLAPMRNGNYHANRGVDLPSHSAATASKPPNAAAPTFPVWRAGCLRQGLIGSVNAATSSLCQLSPLHLQGEGHRISRVPRGDLQGIRCQLPVPGKPTQKPQRVRPGCTPA